MADTSVNRFIASGDNAARAAFTPNPGTPTPTPAQGYTFWDTDDQTLYAYDFGLADWVAVGGAGSGTIGGSTGAADEAVIVADGTGGSTIQATPLLVNSSTGLITFPDDVRQVFNPGVNAAGLNVGAVAADPGTPVNGDIWYDSAANELTARINGANVALGGAGGAKSFQFTFDGQGSDITVGKTVYIQAQASGTMTDWVIGADAVGAIVIDVWKKATFPPAIGDSITAAATPELAAADTDTDTTAGWSDDVVSDLDWFAASVISCTGITWAILQVRVTP